MKPKRLLCIVGKMDAGGAETFLMKIYRNIDRNNYQMDFCIASCEIGIYEQEILDKGGKIFHITQKTENFFKYFNDLYSVVKNNKYERVLRIGADCFCALDLWIAFLAGAKVRAFRSSNSGVITGNVVTNLHSMLKRPLLSIANVKIAPSDLSAKFTFGEKAIKKNKVSFLHNGLDCSLYKYELNKRIKIRKEFNLNDEFVIGHIGRFNKQKNHLFLLELFSEIAKENENIKLFLVGKGELEKDIKNTIKMYGIENKVIISNVRNDIPDILSSFDLVVFPSLFEGMPNVIIEAQASDLKCIVSDAITKEVDITGNVSFLPLTNMNIWIDEINKNIELKNSCRKDNYSKMYESGYDINSVVNNFIDILYKR